MAVYYSKDQIDQIAVEVGHRIRDAVTEEKIAGALTDSVTYHLLSKAEKASIDAMLAGSGGGGNTPAVNNNSYLAALDKAIAGEPAVVATPTFYDYMGLRNSTVDNSNSTYLYYRMEVNGEIYNPDATLDLSQIDNPYVEFFADSSGGVSVTAKNDVSYLIKLIPSEEQKPFMRNTELLDADGNYVFYFGKDPANVINNYLTLNSRNAEGLASTDSKFRMEVNEEVFNADWTLDFAGLENPYLECWTSSEGKIFFSGKSIDPVAVTLIPSPEQKAFTFEVIDGSATVTAEGNFKFTAASPPV